MSNKQLNMRNLLLRKKTCSFHTIENGACHRVAVSFGVPRSFRFALFHALVFKHVFTKFGWGGGCQSFFFQTEKNVIDANVSMVFNACGQTCPFGKLANGWCSQAIWFHALGFAFCVFFSMHSMFQHVACKTVCHTLEETISSFTGIDGRSIFLNHPWNRCLESTSLWFFPSPFSFVSCFKKMTTDAESSVFGCPKLILGHFRADVGNAHFDDAFLIPFFFLNMRTWPNELNINTMGDFEINQLCWGRLLWNVSILSCTYHFPRRNACPTKHAENMSRMWKVCVSPPGRG